MPVIPLLDYDGKPFDQLELFLTLRAIMYRPNDIASAIAYRALGANGLSDLFKDATLKISKKGTGGTITANVFLQLLQLKIHRPADASVGKAVFLISRQLEKLPSVGGRKPPADKDNVHKFWTEFRPAAHLWGAAMWLDQTGVMPLDTEEQMAASTDKILFVANAFLTTAIALKFNFDPDPWTLPVGYPIKLLNISLPPPRAEVIALLKEYRAPIRQK